MAVGKGTDQGGTLQLPGEERDGRRRRAERKEEKDSPSGRRRSGEENPSLTLGVPPVARLSRGAEEEGGAGGVGVEGVRVASSTVARLQFFVFVLGLSHRCPGVSCCS